MRMTACVRDEQRVQRQFDIHNSNCTDGENCYLTVLENVLVRRIHFAIQPSEEQEIVPFYPMSGAV